MFRLALAAVITAVIGVPRVMPDANGTVILKHSASVRVAHSFVRRQIGSSLWDSATPSEVVYLACVRSAESGGVYEWGWNPWGTGDGGGAYQLEPTDLSTAARLVGLPNTDHSKTAQDNEALALLRSQGTVPWALDPGCTLTPSIR